MYLKLIKKDGKFIEYTKGDVTKYELWKKALPEGTIIEMYASEITGDKTLAQLAKIHASIRTIAKNTGYTFEEVKLLIKQRCGLCIKHTEAGEEKLHCSSFADISIEQANKVIEEFANFLQVVL